MRGGRGRMSRAVCAKLHEHEGRMRERTVRGGLCE